MSGLRELSPGVAESALDMPLERVVRITWRECAEGRAAKGLAARDVELCRIGRVVPGGSARGAVRHSHGVPVQLFVWGASAALRLRCRL